MTKSECSLFSPEKIKHTHTDKSNDARQRALYMHILCGTGQCGTGAAAMPPHNRVGPRDMTHI